MGRTGLDRVLALSVKTKLAVGGSVLAAIGGLLLFMGGRNCSSHEDVEARVAEISSAFQRAAAEGRLQVADLADGVKRLNAASTAYESDKDAGAFCEELDLLAKEARLTEASSR